jgi:hypothetical protein
MSGDVTSKGVPLANEQPFCKNVPTVRSKMRKANTVARRRVLITIAVAVAACVVAVVFCGKGRRDIVLDGTLQWGFEESAFFSDGDCSNKPFWWEWPNNRDTDLDAKWKALGKPTALRVKVRGNLSAFGCMAILERIVAKSSQSH